MRPLLATVVTVYALWALWCWLMIELPIPFAEPLIRAVVRVTVVALPAIIFVWKQERAPVLETLGFTGNVGYGILWGVLAGAVILGLTLYRLRLTGFAFQPPVELAIWANGIVGSPVAEEMLFRGVVYRVLRKSMGGFIAALISAIGFSLLHAPWWIISGEKQGMQLAVGLGTMVLYGLGFAMLYQYSKSLWSSIVAHCLNNFVAIALVSSALLN